MIESALDTFAFSHGGAAGPWQFIRGTARHYGLHINAWYDGRRDVVASTEAALTYLSDLHQRFDDWYLALAGYNAGQGNVNKALRRNPDAGFFDLKLPRETRAYVPRLLALAAIVHDPAAHGLTLPPVRPVIAFAPLNTHGQFQIDKLADLIGLSVDDLYQWNPALNQWATPPAGPHRVLVPTSLDLAQSQSRIDRHPAAERVDWREIRVSQGDTLSQIARRHGLDTASIRMANSLPDSRIRAGQKLLIPAHGQVIDAPPRHATGGTVYVVRPGDSLWQIARNHSVSLNRLMRANHLGPKDTLSVGHKLTIPGVGKAHRSVTRKVNYRVRRGDSLARIAQKFNVSIRQIADWNGLDIKRYLQPGQPLALYVDVLAGR